MSEEAQNTFKLIMIPTVLPVYYSISFFLLVLFPNVYDSLQAIL